VIETYFVIATSVLTTFATLLHYFLDVEFFTFHPRGAPVPLILPDIEVHPDFGLVLRVAQARFFAHWSTWLR